MMDDGWIAVVLIGAALMLAVRLLVPKLLTAESAGKGFAIGVGLFGIYTVLTVILFYYFCNFEGNGYGTGEEAFARCVVAFLIVNLIVLFNACLYFFTREKRKMKQTEKMKLKDL